MRSSRQRSRESAPTPVPPSETADVVSLTDVTRTFGRGDSVVHALRGVSIGMTRGSFTAVMGPSGSGKSTLLQTAAGLDRPSSGSVRLGGTELTTLSEEELTRLRRERIGFVFQSFNLLPSLTAADNVLLPLRLSGRPARQQMAREVLDRVGLGGHVRRRPAELSGGQQQRVAIARALVSRPDVVFGDEPTGALDSGTAAEVLRLLRGIVDEDRATVVMVTHDALAASYADRVVFLADGRIVADLARPSVQQIADRMVELTGPGAQAGALR
ncbi:ABC transporter ATP-binding protein [Modestobacter italicus]|uniref:ABC transporter ATP-binding protein n=1 Tax=Modestobacter italicus (strain DSM 44449 / CECT 9708 / BC 501) TaxID=2732864 RepID=UPI001C93FE8B|nr:ABC transporter ATP-binding protein [Modestobacter italicus]